MQEPSQPVQQAVRPRELDSRPAGRSDQLLGHRSEIILRIQQFARARLHPDMILNFLVRT
jgi:hypothetical protein